MFFSVRTFLAIAKKQNLTLNLGFSYITWTEKREASDSRTLSLWLQFLSVTLSKNLRVLIFLFEIEFFLELF